jgi:hypothetical protein
VLAGAVVTAGASGAVAWDRGGFDAGAPVVAVAASDRIGAVVAVTDDRRLVIGVAGRVLHSVEMRIPGQCTRAAVCGGFGFVAVVANADGASLLALFTVNAAKVADARAGLIVAIEAVTDAADTDFLLVAESPGKLRLWAVPALRPVRTIIDVEHRITCLHYSAAAQKIVVGMESGHVYHGTFVVGG